MQDLAIKTTVREDKPGKSFAARGVVGSTARNVRNPAAPIEENIVVSSFPVPLPLLEEPNSILSVKSGKEMSNRI